MSNKLAHYECDGQMNIFDFINKKKVKLVRKNESEEPKQPVNIKGICDDAYCPECDYQLDDLKELDCEQCPECSTRLDWTPWHRANDEDGRA